jgi:hypothetical protein
MPSSTFRYCVGGCEKSDRCDARHVCSNMLTISFGTRTDSTIDPLTERALALAAEFMDLTGKNYLSASLHFGGSGP